jgi:very-short-patch-repair endonuclease
MSFPEVLLWQALRGKAMEGLRLRRQQPLGPFVADFYCPAHRLVIEVDGQTHTSDDQREYDDRRDLWMRNEGIAVLRIPAQVVLSDMDSAIMTVLAAITENPPPGREASRGRGTAGPT